MSSLYVLGVAGSPRRNANSETLLDRALEGARDAGAETGKIVAARLSGISPCVNCGHCRETGRCRISDRMQEVYAELDRASGLVVASPVFFMGVTAFLKILIDRCQCYWARKYVLGRPPPAWVPRGRAGIFLSTAGHDKPVVFGGSRMTVKAWFDVLDVAYRDEHLVTSMEAPDDVRGAAGALERARAMGRSLAEALAGGAP